MMDDASVTHGGVGRVLVRRRVGGSERTLRLGRDGTFSCFVFFLVYILLDGFVFYVRDG